MPKIVDRKAKKQEILQAAIQAFASKGAAATKIHDIAEAAGVSQGTIYLYFDSKEEIFEEVIKLHASPSEGMSEQLMSLAGDPRDKLKEFVLQGLKGAQHENSAIMLDIWSALIREPHRFKRLDAGEGMAQFRQIICGFLDEGIQKGIFREVDTQSLASAIIGLIHGLNLLWMTDSKQFPSTEIAEKALNIILQGIEMPSA
jgi:TetR/AcrR family fatty acid metabolism transcriptional regulator